MMGEGIRVLLVDDDPEFLDLARRALEEETERITVETATSASDGVDHLATETFDCVVSEYELPAQDGIEFLQTVRDSYPDLPFILCTGNGSETVASEAISAGVTEYLQKGTSPEQVTDLANRIREAIDHARSHRERHRTLTAIETAHEGISIIDTDGYYTSVTDAFARLYGYDPQELEGSHWTVTYPDDVVARVETEIIPAVDANGYWHGTMTGLRADGSTFLADKIVAKTENGDFVSTVREVTDRTDLRQKFELVVRASTDAFWDWDPETETIDRSENYLAQFGYENADIGDAYAWWSERIHPEDRDRVLTGLDEAVETPEETYDETYRFRRKDGTYGYIRSRGYVVYDENDTPIRMVGAHIDITERKEREAQLNTLARRFDAIFENPLTLIGLLQPDGTLAEVNQTAMDILSVPSEEVIGEPFWETPWWNHDSALQADLQEWISRARDGDYVRFEAEHVTNDGERVTVDGLIHPVRDEAGEITELVAIARDITERTAYQRALERQNERLEEFTSIVSHDLRNPLNVAIGRLELVRDEYESEHLASVHRAHDRMQTLIEDLLTLAREGETAGEVEPVNLAAIIEQCWRNVDMGGASLQIATDATIRAERSRLAQILENLFRNAVEHGGDDVTVTVGGIDESGVYVADDGQGIPGTDPDAVFEPGYTTTDDGSGLGLAIVRQGVEAHDWDIAVTESADGGARFEITGVSFCS